MNPNPADMLVFLEVIDARSFTSAADQLGKTKSAISQTITRLEDNLGCKLLYRSTRSLALTEAGTRFYAHCKELKQTYDSALSDIEDANALDEGSLTVTAPHALSTPLLLPVMTGYMQQFQKLKISLLSSDTTLNLAEARIDLAIRVGEQTPQGARITKLGDIGESLYASPGYIKSRPPFSGQLCDLSNWDHIANNWQGNPVTYKKPDGQCLRAKPKVRCNTLPDVRYLAIAGVGVALLPDLAARDALEAGELEVILPMEKSPVFVLHEFGRHPPKKVTAFIDMLRAALKTSG